MADFDTTSQGQQEANPMAIAVAAREEGEQFVQGLVYDLGLAGKTNRQDPTTTSTLTTSPTGVHLSERWPSRIGKLFRIYKHAGGMFERALYDASSDLFPADAFYEMTRLRTYLWEDDEESVELWTGVDFLHSGCMVVLADAVCIRSSAERVYPEMVLALVVALEARQWVDWWSQEDRKQRPYDAEAERQSRGHERFSLRLIEVLELLQPELRRWYEGVDEMLMGVQDEVKRVALYDI